MEKNLKRTRALSINIQNKEGGIYIYISTSLLKDLNAKGYVKFGYNKRSKKLILLGCEAADEVSVEVKEYCSGPDSLSGRVANKQLVEWLKSFGFSGKVVLAYNEIERWFESN